MSKSFVFCFSIFWFVVVVSFTEAKAQTVKKRWKIRMKEEDIYLRPHWRPTRLPGRKPGHHRDADLLPSKALDYQQRRCRQLPSLHRGRPRRWPRHPDKHHPLPDRKSFNLYRRCYGLSGCWFEDEGHRQTRMAVCPHGELVCRRERGVESKLLQKGGQLGLSAGSVAGKNAVAVPSRHVRKNAIVYHCL